MNLSLFVGFVRTIPLIGRHENHGFVFDLQIKEFEPFLGVVVQLADMNLSRRSSVFLNAFKPLNQIADRHAV